MDFDIKQHFDQLTPENSKGPYKLHSSRAPAFLLPFFFSPKLFWIDLYPVWWCFLK